MLVAPVNAPVMPMLTTPLKEPRFKEAVPSVKVAALILVAPVRAPDIPMLTTPLKEPRFKEATPLVVP